MLTECLQFVVNGRTAYTFIEPTREIPDFFPSYRLVSLLRLLKSLPPLTLGWSSVGSMARVRRLRFPHHEYFR